MLRIIDKLGEERKSVQGMTWCSAAAAHLKKIPVMKLVDALDLDAVSQVTEELFKKSTGAIDKFISYSTTKDDIMFGRRLHGLLFALTRDFFASVTRVLQDADLMALKLTSGLGETIELAKECVTTWQDGVNATMQNLDKKLKGEGIKGGLYMEAGVTDVLDLWCEAYRARLKAVKDFRTNHEKIAAAITKIEESGGWGHNAKECNESMKKAYATAKTTSWVDGVLPGDAGADNAWDDMMTKYSEAVDGVDELIIQCVRQDLGRAKDAQAMLRVFNKVNALFVRPRIKNSVAGKQDDLLHHVKMEVEKLSDILGQGYSGEVSTMSRLRDMSEEVPSRAQSASRSLRRALVMPQVNPGSLYRCG